MSGDNIVYLESPELDELEQRATSNDTMSGGDSAPAVSVPEIPTAELLKPVLSVSWSVLNPSHPLSDGHSAALAEAYAPLIDKYFPNIANSMGVELNAVIITGMVIAERMAESAAIRAEKEKAQANEKPTKQQPAPASNNQFDWAEQEKRAA